MHSLIPKRKGFTLIELLVVISIISVLSTIVLVSLKSARDRASNSAIRSNLISARTQASIYHDNQGHYGTNTFVTANCATAAGLPLSETVFADPVIQSAIDAAKKASGSSSVAYCHSVNGPPALNWMIAIPISGDPAGNYWCFDSQGGFFKVLPGFASSLAGFCVDNQIP